MARYVLPTFNLDCGIWRHGTAPPAAPALHTAGNLSPGEITGVGALETMPLLSSAQVPMFLRMPALTDIRDAKAVAGADNVEVPFGSGRYYDVAFVDDIAIGFPNEHRFAVLLGRTPWATPFGGGGPPPPPPPVGNWFNFFPSTSLGIPVTVLAGPLTIVPLGDRQMVMVATYGLAGPAPQPTITRGGIPVFMNAGAVSTVLGIQCAVFWADLPGDGLGHATTIAFFGPAVSPIQMIEATWHSVTPTFTNIQFGNGLGMFPGFFVIPLGVSGLYGFAGCCVENGATMVGPVNWPTTSGAGNFFDVCYGTMYRMGWGFGTSPNVLPQNMIGGDPAEVAWAAIANTSP